MKNDDYLRKSESQLHPTHCGVFTITINTLSFIRIYGMLQHYTALNRKRMPNQGGKGFGMNNWSGYVCMSFGDLLKSLALVQSPSPKVKPWAKAFH